MTFTVEEFRNWINVLYEHPEWREELRRLTLTDDILELPGIVRELAESQRELAAAQQRTEQRVEELAEAQRGSEQRLTSLEKSVQALAEAQRGSEQRLTSLEAAVEKLVTAQTRLDSAVGELQRAFGSTVEEEAASVLEVILRRKGYRILHPAYSLGLNGEIDVVLPAESPSGEAVWAVVEAKARLSQRDVLAWSQRMRSEDWRKQLAEKGVEGPYLVYAYSIRSDLGAQELAEKKGIGLLKSDGETLAPRELIQPAAA